MSLLTVNGIAVPVAVDTLRLGERVVGADRAADDGSLHRTRSAYMDELAGSTRLLSPSEAAMWRGLLNGRGHRWAFDTDPDGTSTDPSADGDVYSSRGLLLSGTASRRGGYAQYALEVSGSDTVISLGIDSKFDQAIAVERDTVNLFPERVRRAGDLGSGSSLAGFSETGGGTLALETGVVFEGANSVKFTPATPASDYFEVASGYRAPPDGLDLYVFSFYMKASVAMNVVASVETDAPSSTPATFAVTTSWRRFVIPYDYSSGTVTEMWLKWIPQSAGIVYVDAIQCEQGPSFARSWVGAASDTRATGSLTATLGDLRRQDDVTIAGWFNLSSWDLFNDAPGTLNATLWAIGTGTEGLYLRRKGSNGHLELHVISGGVDTVEAEYSTDILDKAWHHVAVTMWRNDPAENKLTLWVDGVDVDQTSVVTLPTLSAPTLYVGTFAGSDPLDGYVDEFVVLPFGVPADVMPGIYAARFSSFPRLNVSGDVVNGETIECLGAVTADGLRLTFATDTHRNASLAFKLSQAVR